MTSTKIFRKGFRGFLTLYDTLDLEDSFFFPIFALASLRNSNMNK